MIFKLKGYSIAKHNFLRIYFAHIPLEKLVQYPNKAGARSRRWLYRFALMRMKGRSVYSISRVMGLSTTCVCSRIRKIEREINVHLRIVRKYPIKVNVDEN